MLLNIADEGNRAGQPETRLSRTPYVHKAVRVRKALCMWRLRSSNGKWSWSVGRRGGEGNGEVLVASPKFADDHISLFLLHIQVMRLFSCLLLLAATSFSRASIDTEWETIPLPPDDAANSFPSVDIQPVDTDKQSFFVANSPNLCSTAPDAIVPGSNKLRAREGSCRSTKQDDLPVCPMELFPWHLCCNGQVSLPGFVDGCFLCS